MVAQNSQRQTEEYITGVLADIEYGLKRYRELSASAAPIEKVIKSNAFAYCDEFMSHYTLFYLQIY